MILYPYISLFFFTALSGLAAFLFQKKTGISVKLFLAFSGAFLLATTVMHLLPEIYRSPVQAGPFILLGFFIQILIEYFSQGVEHGHIHEAHHKTAFPYMIYFGLCIHAVTEGIPLSGTEADKEFFRPLYWGILLHNIPIAFILVTLFNSHQINIRGMISGILIFALMAPLGGMIGNTIAFLFNSETLIYFLAVSTGIFLHISTVIIFETSHNHRFNLLKFLFILAGALLSLIFF